MPIRLMPIPLIKKQIQNLTGRHLPAPPEKGQLELPIYREKTADRNAAQGGRSFYFFDFDDNVAFLTTPTYIFHKKTRQAVPLTSGEFAQVHRLVGKTGPY